MDNQQIARIFDHISQILQLQGENPFKVRAYTRASEVIRGLTYELADAGPDASLEKLPGIGKKMALKIEELLETGKLEAYEELKKSDYAPLVAFLDIRGVGPKHAKLIFEALSINTIEALEQAASQGKLRGLPGLGPKAEANILKGIQDAKKYKERTPLAQVLPKARAILSRLSSMEEAEQAVLAGSVRRMRETVADVDILVASKHPDRITKAFVALAGPNRPEQIIAQGETKSSILTDDGFQIDLRVVAPESFGAAAHYFTGSKAHNIRIRSLAQERGLKVNEYGVYDGETRIGGATEEQIFEAVGLPFIPPEIREDQGEIEAAQQSKLPDLIRLDQIKGDLHVHTNYSDGQSTVEEMARAAKDRGYSYLAICDHSPAVGITNGLTAERLAVQREEIERANKMLDGFRVLAGIEVDIRSDNTLDLEDDALARLDLVVAAVHTKLGQPKNEMTRRIITAIEHPSVHIIAHPTGRLIGRREPYEVDMEKVMDACKANGKVLELNAHPERLDLSDTHCRKAKEKGLKIAISTDSHSDTQLELMEYGIANARRGWIEGDDVINTLPLEKLLGFLQK